MAWGGYFRSATALISHRAAAFAFRQVLIAARGWASCRLPGTACFGLAVSGLRPLSRYRNFPTLSHLEALCNSRFGATAIFPNLPASHPWDSSRLIGSCFQPPLGGGLRFADFFRLADRRGEMQRRATKNCLRGPRRALQSVANLLIQLELRLIHNFFTVRDFRLFRPARRLARRRWRDRPAGIGSHRFSRSKPPRSRFARVEWLLLRAPNFW